MQVNLSDTPTVDVIIAEPGVLIVTLYADIGALTIIVRQPTLFKDFNIFPHGTQLHAFKQTQ